jgi:enoyl-CoA hydratase
MSDVLIRTEGRAGRITLNRPKALNALNGEMVRGIDAALAAWAEDDSVALLVIDGAGERAFCSGGDISEMYRTGRAGDYAWGRAFWAEEYRMNRRLFRFPKPVASFLHGFVMGGGVGVGCHGSHRVVGESVKVAMPESGIGLVPDVGGSLLLSRAPGRVGEYLGTTGTRMGPADAIHAEFADYFLPEAAWPDLIAALERTGEWHRIDEAAEAPPPSDLAAQQPEIDDLFGGETLRDIVNALTHSRSRFAVDALGILDRNSPLSMACTVELIHRVRAGDTIERALTLEHRYTYRSMEHGDFLEGVRAAIIDKDRQPGWRHDGPSAVPPAEVARMLAPLDADELTWGET